MSEKLKNKLWGVFAVVLVTVAAVWMIANPGPEHIEDANGAEDHSLAVITQQDIVEHKMGSRGGISVGESGMDIGNISISKGIKHSSKKFTGVYPLYACTLFKGSDIYVRLSNFEVNSGNFAFCIVFDGQVIGTAEPDEFGTAEFRLDNVEKTGTLEYILAGESANFKFFASEEW